jgi:hypothetical protein
MDERSKESTDTTIVQVIPPEGDFPQPVANAGDDTSLTLYTTNSMMGLLSPSCTAFLDGSKSYSAWRDDFLRYEWVQMSGESVFDEEPVSYSNYPYATFGVGLGEYNLIFALRVYDGISWSDYDYVTYDIDCIDVNSSGNNSAEGYYNYEKELNLFGVYYGEAIIIEGAPLIQGLQEYLEELGINPEDLILEWYQIDGDAPAIIQYGPKNSNGKIIYDMNIILNEAGLYRFVVVYDYSDSDTGSDSYGYMYVEFEVPSSSGSLSCCVSGEPDSNANVKIIQSINATAIFNYLKVKYEGGESGGGSGEESALDPFEFDENEAIAKTPIEGSQESGISIDMEVNLNTYEMGTKIIIPIMGAGSSSGSDSGGSSVENLSENLELLEQALDYMELAFTPDNPPKEEYHLEATIVTADATYPININLTFSSDYKDIKADAGSDRCVLIGNTVYLDGSGSEFASVGSMCEILSTNDYTGFLTYSWIPKNDNVSLIEKNYIQPQFVYEQYGKYNVGLNVSCFANDTNFTSLEDTVNINIKRLPIAKINVTQYIFNQNDIIYFDASESSDPDDFELDYVWSAGFYEKASSIKQGFIAEFEYKKDESGKDDKRYAQVTLDENFKPGKYSFYLKVDNSCEDYVVRTEEDDNIDVVNIRVNSQPVANIADVATIYVGDEIILDGSTSFDPDIEDGLTYKWDVVRRGDPVGRQLSGSQEIFNPSEPGEYTITLVVNDGYIDSEPAIMTISVIKNSTTDDDGGVLNTPIDDATEIPTESNEATSTDQDITEENIEDNIDVGAQHVVPSDVIDTGGCGCTVTGQHRKFNIGDCIILFALGLVFGWIRKRKYI